jgi:O-succinylbenzoate synthase
LANPHVEFAFFQINQGPLKDENYLIKENELIESDKLIDHIKNVQEKAVLKFKVNKELTPSFLSELSLALKESSHPILLRPDANQTMSVSQLTTLWSSLKEKNIQAFIDYFEEPLADYGDYSELPNDLPYAHEELLSDYLKAPSLAKAIVVKPSQKGIHVLQRLKKKELKGTSPRIILSSAFEFEEDIPSLKELAHTYSPHEYHGLKASLSKSAILKTETVKF